MGKLLREHYNRIDPLEEAVEGFLLDTIQNNIASDNNMSFGAGNNTALASNNTAFGAGNNAAFASNNTAFGAGNNTAFSPEVNAAIDAEWGNLSTNFNGTNNSGFFGGNGASNNGARNGNGNSYFDFTANSNAGGFSAETNAAIDAAWGNLDNASLNSGRNDGGVVRSSNSLQNSGA